MSTATRTFQLPSSDPYDRTRHACTVSAVDADLMNLYKWRVDTVSGRVVAGSDRQLVQLAWLVCARQHGPRPGRDVVDHHDGVVGNNTRTKLFYCSASANNMNSVRRPGVSGYRGVWREEKHGRTVWRARLKFGRQARPLNCGTWATAAEAARAYDARLRRLIDELAGTPAGAQLRRCARFNLPVGPTERSTARGGVL
jgi:hypothetical protein